jgi:microcystin degradation protein MlrC
MGAVGEPDPEGFLLERVRTLFGPEVPMVVSLDLHGILTTRMLHQIDGLTVYHTYPHVDFANTGRRAAELLLDIIRRGLKPVIARVRVPLLARGDECITRTGCYGDVIADAQALERGGQALAAGVMIGNPFTDAPELCTQALVVAESDAAAASAAATLLAETIWASRHRLVGKLVSVEKAVAMAPTMTGPVLFTDAADATSSGASGDSNVLIKALHAAGYPGRVLAQIVDPPAAAAAHRAGCGAEITVTLGGFHDPARFTPMQVTATVESLSRGQAKLETMGQPLDAGPTAVLRFGTFTVVVMSHTVSLFDRAMYYSNGLDPVDFDLIVVKSPHTEFHMYDQWVTKNFNVDAPGATSANLPTLGHRLCARPIFPLDPDTVFVARPETYARTVPA